MKNELKKRFNQYEYLDLTYLEDYKFIGTKSHGLRSSNLNPVKDMYKDGDVLEQDYQQAIKWYERASEKGDQRAQLRLGLMHKNGDGVAKNYTEAKRFLTLGAKQGEPLAQHDLALMYENGEGVEQNYQKSFQWHQSAAEQDYPPAQCSLANLLEQGEGVEQDYEEALNWYQRAADDYDGFGIYNIGRFYSMGLVFSKNIFNAYTCYSVALELGVEEAQIAQNEIINELTKAEISKAQKLAQKYAHGEFDVKEWTALINGQV